MFVINYSGETTKHVVNNDETQDVIMNNESFVMVN